MNPRELTGGKFGYVYRREAGSKLTPGLDITHKLEQKEGIIFTGARDFWKLNANGEKIKDSTSMTPEELDDLIQEERDKEKEKKRKKKRVPSVSEIRKHLAKIIEIHEKNHKDAFPCVYPLMDDVMEHKSQAEGKNSSGTKRGRAPSRCGDTYNKPAPSSSKKRKKTK